MKLFDGNYVFFPILFLPGGGEDDSLWERGVCVCVCEVCVCVYKWMCDPVRVLGDSETEL